jgi:hypothetical protein
VNLMKSGYIATAAASGSRRMRGSPVRTIDAAECLRTKLPESSPPPPPSPLPEVGGAISRGVAVGDFRRCAKVSTVSAGQNGARRWESAATVSS